VNNLPVSVRISPDQQVAEWLSDLHARNTEIAEHQYASVAQIQEWAGVPWRLRLFDSLLVFQNYVVDEAVLRLGAAVVEPVAAPERTNYPLTLTVTPGPDLDLKLVGQANRFGHASLSMMLDGLATVLARIAPSTDASLRELLASLPASTRGRAAAAPAGPPRMRLATYAAAVSQMERAVADVWQDLFQISPIGMEDNFFDLGGHSILLLQAHARLREKLDPQLPVVALLQYPTIRSLARHLSGASSPGADHDAMQDRVHKQRQALARRRTLQGKR
jgi:non-ribosomal peptide synthetase component F